MSKHTPTPWQVNGSAIGHGDKLIAQTGFQWLTNEDTEANAELIVRAVNAHDALVAALVEARAWVEWIDVAVPDGLDGARATIKHIDAALALAEGR